MPVLKEIYVKRTGTVWKSIVNATFLIYLNEGFEGGETDFPKKNKKVKPVTGKGAVF